MIRPAYYGVIRIEGGVGEVLSNTNLVGISRQRILRINKKQVAEL